MKAGKKLLPAYAGSGYNERTRFFADGSSRMYFMEAIESEAIEEKRAAETAEAESVSSAENESADGKAESLEKEEKRGEKKDVF